MPRATNRVASHRRHREVIKAVKGHRGTRSKLWGKANESLMRALQYAYRDRRNRKRDLRRLWITRINAAARLNGLSYSQLMHGLQLANVEIDRKILADMAVKEPQAFAGVVEQAKQAIAAHS
ncbi:ribosomal protein L20 [Thermobaculum terrenum ATCC BAA-798]|uniref:Large ribosomal subunit protein bL20 n=1 Tax=Thermobaculum terrenum (strain ATCC BAA-798 / CCMEE 7001 / YNP1) TaxID=525904 RepID=D1CFH9_THET1|nr:50S ribosomal protein L20 [Thermobaculum terrenum]ACZ41685.1 ribosomal protein L20 [Thermobaculum terrenum ATCC BAA-798]